MSQRARIIIIALAAVGLVLAFFAARGSEESDDPPVTAPATQRAPADDGGATAPDETATPTTTQPAEPAEPEIPVVRVVDAKPQGGVQELDFEEGDRVRFRVRSDVADHVHVHGYDIMRDVGPGQTATFSFDGDITGRFEVELEDRGVEIASLRVSP